MTARPAAAAGPAATPDAESRGHDAHHESLRLWLRLFACTTLVERQIRVRLRERFATTLPRFDLMAQLQRHPDGLRMGELSRRMMVTGGNVTGITDQLVAEGLVERVGIPDDRRAFAVRLTPRGRAAFDAMAREHEGWVEALFAPLGPPDRDRLFALLGRLKAVVGGGDAPTPAPAPPRRGRRKDPR